MPEKNSQSLNITKGQLSNVQIGGMAGNEMNVSQTQQIDSDNASETLTQKEVVELIAQLEDLFLGSGLPQLQTAKITKYLETAKEEVQESEPDKDFTAKNLKRATKVLEEAGGTLDAGTNLWEKIKPIFETISPWLGVATNFFI